MFKNGKLLIVIVIFICKNTIILERQFDWGGCLLKSNGGAQRFPQHGRKSCEECKGIRELECETYRSSKDESRT